MLTTKRLVLRPWRDSDLEPLAALFGDTQVMRYFNRTRSPAEAARWMARTQGHIDRHGFGIWAIEAPEVADFIGFAGLSHVPADMPPAPSVEVVWTLATAFWRQGYATEAALAAMFDGYDRMDLRELVAFTAATNWLSRRVMQRLLMVPHPEDDFDHPHILAGHPLRRHVVYRRLRPAGLKPIRIRQAAPEPEAAPAPEGAPTAD